MKAPDSPDTGSRAADRNRPRLHKRAAAVDRSRESDRRRAGLSGARLRVAGVRCEDTSASHPCGTHTTLERLAAGRRCLERTSRTRQKGSVGPAIRSRARVRECGWTRPRPGSKPAQRHSTERCPPRPTHRRTVFACLRGSNPADGRPSSHRQAPGRRCRERQPTGQAIEPVDATTNRAPNSGCQHTPDQGRFGHITA